MSDQDTADATSAATDEEQNNQEDASKDADSDLGDKGKKALDAMKAERTAARAEATRAKRELEELRAELALKDKPAEEQQIEKAKAEARTEATAAANKRIVRAELKALATGKLADPSDAALYINLDDFTVTDDGDVDTDALDEAITELLTRKPHLAATNGARFQGAGDGGAGAKAKPDESIDDAIAAARAARNTPLVVTLQTQKAAALASK